MECIALTDEERSEWQEDVDSNFDFAHEQGLSDSACIFLTEFTCEALDGDFEWMLDLIADNAPLVTRWNKNELFNARLKRAYEHAISCGFAGACCNLANMYHITDGNGNAEDYAKAVELYEMGADWGDAQSAVNLGYIYFYGRGQEIDYGRAYECYARAAVLDKNPEALWKLGDLYMGGLGVRQSGRMGWEMYLKAFEEAKDTDFECRAAHHVADCLLTGIDEVLDPDPELALELYLRAELGYYSAIDNGLDYYESCLADAIEGQQKAREAVKELHKQIREGE